jgi:ribosomal protein S10
MKQYCLKITSKNEKSIKKFLQFFSAYLNSKFNVIRKSIVSRNNKKTVTLLKSPHVNKTAQEHFEVRLFTKKMLVKGVYLRKNLIFFKKVFDKLFQDIYIQLEFTTSPSINKTDKLSSFSSDNFKLHSSKNLKTNLRRQKQKKISKKFKLRKHSLFDLTKFLYAVSTFGEINVRTSLKP